jgi:hypothetical protein
MSGSLLDNLDVFYGELTSARATVYARLEGLENSEGLSLSGFVRGPRCFYSKTLPATFRLQDAGPGPSLLAKALIPDPSYWSPDTPHIYDVTVELRKGTDIIASEVRQIGFKPLGISGRFFTWEGKPWVPRAVMIQSSTWIPLIHWREQNAVCCEPWMSDDRLLEASEKGVMCFLSAGHPEGSEDDAIQAARRLAKYPAVGFANLYIVTNQVRRCIPNIISGCLWGFELDADLIQSVWAFNRQIDSSQLADLVALNKPMVATRIIGPLQSVAQCRVACDELQASLAPMAQFAGYLAMSIYA